MPVRSRWLPGIPPATPCAGLPVMLLAALLAATPALADPPGGHGGYGYPRRDHDAARAALASGEIRPIGDILAAVAASVPGDLVAVELEREHGRWVYEVKVIDPDGRRREVYIDAATTDLLPDWDDD